MFTRLVIIVLLIASVYFLAINDTGKQVFTSIRNTVSGIFSSSGDEGEPQSLPTERILLHTRRGDLPLTVEIADSKDEREIGLMYRKTMPLGTGMLFVFEDEISRNFWMKKTYVPLDIIFFSSKKKVTSMVEGMMPCDETMTNQLCTLYNSEFPAMYALEAPAGFIQANGIQVGDEMQRGN